MVLFSVAFRNGMAKSLRGNVTIQYVTVVCCVFRTLLHFLVVVHSTGKSVLQTEMHILIWFCYQFYVPCNTVRSFKRRRLRPCLSGPTRAEREKSQQKNEIVPHGNRTRVFRMTGEAPNHRPPQTPVNDSTWAKYDLHDSFGLVARHIVV